MCLCFDTAIYLSTVKDFIPSCTTPSLPLKVVFIAKGRSGGSAKPIRTLLGLVPQKWSMNRVDDRNADIKNALSAPLL